MKVLGRSENGVVADVSFDEIVKVFGHYGRYDSNADNVLRSLRPGSTLDLGKGRDFTQQIEAACQRIVDLNEAFQQATKTMQAFAEMVLHYKQLREIEAAEELRVAQEDFGISDEDLATK